ncbi:MAG: rhodanese-like domain-containing protein [Desulfovibrionales bacterium]
MPMKQAIFLYASRAFMQAAVVIAAALIFGTAANLIRPESLPWLPPSEETRSEIGFQQALAFWQQDEPVFVDVRSGADFKKGHIKGSMNFPYEAVMTGEADYSGLPQDRLLVLYCEGPACSLAEDLRRTLELLGYEKMTVYMGGWREWQTRGGPVS